MEVSDAERKEVASSKPEKKLQETATSAGGRADALEATGSDDRHKPEHSSSERRKPPPPRRPSRVPHGMPSAPQPEAETLPEAKAQATHQPHSNSQENPPAHSSTQQQKSNSSELGDSSTTGAVMQPTHSSLFEPEGKAESKAISPRESAPPSPSHRPRLAVEGSSSVTDVESASGLKSASKPRLAWGKVPNAQTDTMAAQDAIGRYITKVHEVRSEVADVQAYVDILDRAIEELQHKRALAGGRDAVLHHERRLGRQIDLLEKRILQTKEGYMKAAAHNLELKAKVDARRREKLALRRAIVARTEEGNSLAQANDQLEEDITQLVAARREVESQLDGVQEESRMALGALEREYEALHAEGALDSEEMRGSAAKLVGLVHGTEHAADRAAASAEGERNASGARQAAAGKAAAARARALPAIGKGGTHAARPGSSLGRGDTASRMASRGNVRVGASGGGGGATERLMSGKGGVAGVQLAMKQQQRRASASSPSGWDTGAATPRSATGAGGLKTPGGAPQAERRRKAAKQLSSGLLNVGAIEKGHLHSADGTLFYGSSNKGKYNVSRALAGGALSPVAPLPAVAGGAKIHSPLTAKEPSSDGGVGFVTPVSPTMPPSTPLKPIPALEGSAPDATAGSQSAVSPNTPAKSRSQAAPSSASPNGKPPRRGSIADGSAFGKPAVESDSTLSLRQSLPVQTNWSEVWAVLSAMTSQETPEMFAKRFHAANDANYDLYLRVDALAKEADDLRLAVMRCHHELRSSQLTTAVVDAERTLAMTDVQGKLLSVRGRRAALGERLENVYACEAALGDVLSRMLTALDFSNVGGKTSPRRTRGATMGGAGGSASQRKGGVKSGEGAGSPSTTASGASTKSGPGQGAGAGGGESVPGGAAKKPVRTAGDSLATSLSTGQRLIRQHRMLEQRLRQVLVIFKQSGGDIVALARAQPTPKLPTAANSASAAASSVVEALRTAGGVLGDPTAAMSAEDATAGDGPIKAEMSRRQRRRSVDMSVIEIRRGMLAGANDAYASDEDGDDGDDEGGVPGQEGGVPRADSSTADLAAIGRSASDLDSSAVGLAAGVRMGGGAPSGPGSVPGSSRSGATTQRRRRKNAASVLDERMMILGPDQPGVHGLPTAPLLRAAPPSSVDDGSALRAAEAAVAEFVAQQLV